MPASLIRGVVVSGQGGASDAMQGERLRERSRVAGVRLVPGTLNLRVDDLEGAVSALGPPVAYSDEDNDRLGPLRWWPVWLTLRGSQVEGWVVRHERTRTRYLEIVADVHLRSAGLEDGDEIGVALR